MRKLSQVETGDRQFSVKLQVVVAQPQVTDPIADQRFRSIARDMGLDPDNRWVGGYVNLEWGRSRYILEGFELRDRRVLEFGCNVGANAIICAALGAKVTALDVDASYVELAKANAERHGLADSIQFFHVEDTRTMPFPDASFDLIACFSVLEYVPTPMLRAVQKEIDRVLAPRGIIVINGTSNRLWPKEKHSHRWFTNYVPAALDGLLFEGRSPQRGILPRDVRRGFGDYDNLDLEDGGAAYVSARAKMGMSPLKQSILRRANQLLALGGRTVGLYTPNLSVALQKRS